MLTARMIEGVRIPQFQTRGLVPFLYPTHFDPVGNWAHQYIAWRRTLPEWIFLLEGFRNCRFPTLTNQIPYIPNTPPDPFYHREIVMDILEESFRVNQWFRWHMKRLLVAWRSRIMHRRIVGDVDVARMEAISLRDRVEVYDWSTRTCYRFHAETMHNQIAATLRYQTMAISSPKWPKNPYTNLGWSTWQLRRIYEQVVRWYWEVGRRFVDPVVQAFYQAGLCLVKLEAVYGMQLELECAYQFFKTPTSDAWEYVYNETLIDIFTIVKPNRIHILERVLMDRSLSAQIMDEWDDVVIQFWCYENLHRILPKKATSIYDMIVKTRDLVVRTEAAIQDGMEEARKKRMRTH